MILQAVKRIYEPGCKADYIMVLEGKQGIGKTRLIEILGDPWYADIVIDPHSRDTVDAMIGKWFIEFAEMEVTRRSDAQALKAFITRHTDTVRLAYAKRSIDIPRQCVFIGSINPDASCEYLTDTTGNRRFWPIEIKYLQQEKLKEERDQLFAEAVAAYKGGEQAYITDIKIDNLAMAEQKKRQVSDPWLASIGEWISDKKELAHSVKNVYIFALKGNEASLTSTLAKRISHCLAELGFKNHTERDKELDKVVRVYRHKDYLPVEKEERPDNE
jgi:predicted P-loop ATPase